MSTRHTTLRRFLISVAVLLGVVIAPSIAQFASTNWTTARPFRVLDTPACQLTIDKTFCGIGKRPSVSGTKLQLTDRAGMPKNTDTMRPTTTSLVPVTTTLPAPTTTAVVMVAPTQTTAPTTTVAPTTTAVVTLPPATTTTTTTIPVVTLPPPTTTTTTTAPPASGSGFVHPGVLVDRAQLDSIKADVASGDQTVAAALKTVYGAGGSVATSLRPQNYLFSSLSYVPAPVRVVQAGGNESYLASHGLENIGGQEHADDAKAAYTHALLWYLTGQQAHANKAIEIMNAWSGTLTEIKFDSPVRDDNGAPVFVQGKLQAGWGGSLFARAGEIIRYTGAGWSNNDVARFEAMLHDVHLPLVRSGWTQGANWLMTFSEATISIGVFTNDRAAFNAGVDMWRAKAPTTIYHTNDGSMPKSPASYLNTASELKNYWYGPDRYITGLQGETLRDLSHMTMGLGAMANTAETAYIQGINLYAEQATRIIPGFELQAGYINDYLDEVARRGGQQPTSTWTPNNWPGAPGTFDIGNNFYKSGWNIAYHHYTTRTGTTMPQTAHLIQRLGNSATQPAIHLSWETLTHSP